MDTKFKVGDTFLRGFAYPTQWEVINTKLIFDIVHYELTILTTAITNKPCFMKRNYWLSGNICSTRSCPQNPKFFNPQK